LSVKQKDTASPLCIAVFAHNEEYNIKRCLESVLQATQSPERLKITVLINGCNDQTENVVKLLAKKYHQIRYTAISLGDKSNAWNTYTYGDIDLSVNHYFIDGDNWLPAFSLDKLEAEFDTQQYWGIAPTPIGIKESLREFMIRNRFISGNCYGVSGEFMNHVISNGFKLPTGFIGDDSLVMYLLQEGLEPGTVTKDIKVVETTGAIIPRVPLSIATIGFMHRRYKRYALRHIQQEVLYYLGRNNRINELPASIADFKSILKEIGIKPIFVRAGIQTLYHPYAYYKIIYNRALL